MRSNRITSLLNRIKDVPKRKVIYWMQTSIRYQYNHGLEHAIRLANLKKSELLVVFYLDFSFPNANLRSFKFMLEGLYETLLTLNQNQIAVKVILGKAEDLIHKELIDASDLVMDFAYLRYQRLQRTKIKEACINQGIDINISMVESDLLVPVESIYPKKAYNARIIRGHVLRQMNEFRDLNQMSKLEVRSLKLFESEFDFKNMNQSLKTYLTDQSVLPSVSYIGGYSEAIKMLQVFLDDKFISYGENDPSKRVQSYLSAYLHFGFISVLDILDRLDLYMLEHQLSFGVYDKFIEQLLVRRSLAFNFVYYELNYDVFEYMTEKWAYDTLNNHQVDERYELYSLNEIEYGKTKDIYFNASMDEMRLTGYMPNYLRMYWAKKIMEWQPSMKIAYESIKYLNDKYFIDGRDPNSYASIAWCFGKHDRAWQERKIFGKVRYMSQTGLLSKFDMASYIDYVEKIKKALIT